MVNMHRGMVLSVAVSGWVPGMPKMGEKEQRNKFARQAIVLRAIERVELIGSNPITPKADEFLSAIEGFFGTSTDGDREYALLVRMRKAYHDNLEKLSSFLANFEGADELAQTRGFTTKHVDKVRANWAFKGRSGRGKELMRSGIVLEAPKLPNGITVGKRRIVAR